ncbi:aminotransferase class IV [Salpingoeca rosetta]|uniref:Aminotransferase class IV n=1 Tax=Salpingoeca rosetta (strain ATCC 50818 / BSB-021) TaxID=946362 RepID=F2U903_SALR5|nr:aminotransferase class IV [Salpingoeca rosetta]EGD73206.1 aminotransferase class IV [Salpingoeca rosetta]|eukprot:XP_004994237.1 aminotransferase class IV [Salpingoeca rosetta]
MSKGCPALQQGDSALTEEEPSQKEQKQLITPSTVYLNGEFVPSDQAKVSVFDRGFLFGDAIYEVVSVIHGGIFDEVPHMERLERSLAKVGMPMPMSQEQFVHTILEVVDRNELDEGVVYMQITRGAGDRTFTYNSLVDAGMTQNIVMFAQHLNLLNAPAIESGLSIKTVPDIRWRRCDIKTVQLLGASLSKTAAAREGYNGIWFVDPDTHMITEGDSNNTFIVQGNTVISPGLHRNVLPGITRNVVKEIVEAAEGLEFEEADFGVDAALAADEAFATSAGLFVTGVTSLDGRPISGSKVGPITKRLRKLYIERALEHLTISDN